MNNISKLYSYLKKNNHFQEARFLKAIASVHSIGGNELMDPEEWREFQLGVERSEFANLSPEDQEDQLEFFEEKIRKLEQASHDEIIQMQLENEKMHEILAPLISKDGPSAENNYARSKSKMETDADNYLLQRKNPTNIKRLAEVLGKRHNIDNPGAYTSDIEEADRFLDNISMDEDILLKGLSKLPIDIFASLFLSQRLKYSKSGYEIDHYDYWEDGFKKAMEKSISNSPKDLRTGEVTGCKELINVLGKDDKYKEFLVELKEVCQSFDDYSDDEDSFDYSDHEDGFDYSDDEDSWSDFFK